MNESKQDAILGMPNLGKHFYLNMRKNAFMLINHTFVSRAKITTNLAHNLR